MEEYTIFMDWKTKYCKGLDSCNTNKNSKKYLLVEIDNLIGKCKVSITASFEEQS